MPRTSKDSTRKKLREAVVAEAVENGIGSLSVAGVVDRAKVSAGTVYVHFHTKEDMLQQVFLEIKREFHEIMLRSKSEETSQAMIRRMWFDMFDFVADKPQDFLFLEYGNSARFLTPEQEKEAHQMYAEIGEMLQRGIDDGTLAQLDVTLISMLLVAPAMQLARSAVLKDKRLAQTVVETTFDRVWRSIANDAANR